MQHRTVQHQFDAHAVSEGAGVTVYRTIGTPAIRQLDPFLMLDYFNSDNPDDYIAGFPDHPHRGFCTFTYMLDGHLLHQDSMGNRGDLQSGGGQWMKAASGVIHSEMPQQTDGLMRGFQLWINLPAKEKMSAPEYQEFPADHFPVIQQGNTTIKVIIGSAEDTNGSIQQSPIQDPYTNVQYYDISLTANDQLNLPVPATHNAFVYVFEGNVDIDQHTLPPHTFATLTQNGDKVGLTTTANHARLILVAGKPLGEKVVQQGPFVMNSEAEIIQAFNDYRQGNLVQQKAAVNQNS